jgi:hypothetical protein
MTMASHPFGSAAPFSFVSNEVWWATDVCCMNKRWAAAEADNQAIRSN